MEPGSCKPNERGMVAQMNAPRHLFGRATESRRQAGPRRAASQSSRDSSWMFEEEKARFEAENATKRSSQASTVRNETLTKLVGDLDEGEERDRPPMSPGPPRMTESAGVRLYLPNHFVD